MNNEIAVQVVSETHKLTDREGPATVLSNTIYATPGPNIADRERKPARRTIVVMPPIRSMSGDNSTDGRAIGADDGAQLGSAIPEFASPVIAEITQLWRMRQRWHKAEKSLTLQGKAICRSWCGDKEEASRMFDAAVRDGGATEPHLIIALSPFISAISRFRMEREAIEKRLRKVVVALPVFPWVEFVKGFGALRLASIVGEAGDVGSYRNPSCLWKRMGLAVIQGERQHRTSDAALALEMGYSPERRAISFLLGQELIRGAGKAKNTTYRAIYDERREYEFPRCEALADIMKKKFGKYSPKAHAHNRACRYMTKRVLRDFWAAWRASMVPSHQQKQGQIRD